MANKIITFLRNLFAAILRDLIGAITLFKIEKSIKKFEEKKIGYADVFRQFALKHPKKPCIMYEDQTWTFQDVSPLCSVKALLRSRLSVFFVRGH